LAKEPIIKSYSTEPTVKQNLEENNYEQLSLKIQKTREKILDFQSKTIADISTINNNFKKDSSSRKTKEYLKTCLDNLEKSWATCIDNQDALNVFIKDDEYFKLGVFQQTKKVYDAVKTAIIKLLPPE
jgi:hypothetical protein